MCLSRRRNKRKYLGEIDLAHMDKEQSLVIGRYMEEHKGEVLLRKNHRCTVYLPKTSTQYTFELSNKLLHAENEDTFDVQSNDKLGKGSFGSVRLIMGSLAKTPKEKAVFTPAEETTACVSKKIKQSEGQAIEEFYMDIHKEYALAKKTPHLLFQPLIHFKDSHYQYRDTCYIRMPYFKGITLAKMMETETFLSIDNLIDLSLNLALALRVMVHDGGLIHRDFKPDNIIISEDYQAAIIDIGLAKERDEIVNECVGTLAYMAPEQINDTETSEATDVYALGKIYAGLWNLLTGTLQTNNAAKIEEDILSGNARFDTSQFDLLEGITKKHKAAVLSMVKKMTRFSLEERCGLDDVIAKWDKIKLERELALTLKRYHPRVKKQHAKNIKEREASRDSVRAGEAIQFNI